MKIGLIDVDGHNFPNLALMRISAWHKSQGDTVEWWASEFEYYDIVYMSKVFSDVYSKEGHTPMNCGKVIKGGTGYCIKLGKDGKEHFDQSKNTKLPDYMEKMFPDYSIYPQYNFAVAMTSRGCPRGCPFVMSFQRKGAHQSKSQMCPTFGTVNHSSKSAIRTSQLACRSANCSDSTRKRARKYALTKAWTSVF